jgi:Coenzyme PQQ synthesis protein D (PqqD)
VLWRKTFDRVVVLVPGSDRFLTLSGTGVDLWDSLAEPRSLDAISAELADRYRTASAAVERDVRPALDALVTDGAVLRLGC